MACARCEGIVHSLQCHRVAVQRSGYLGCTTSMHGRGVAGGIAGCAWAWRWFIGLEFDMRTFSFSLLLHDGNSYQGHNHGGVLGVVDWEVKADSLREAEKQADDALRAEFSNVTGRNWWTRSSVQEVKNATV